LPSEQTNEEFINSYINTIDRSVDGRYRVKLPFKDEKPKFDDCKIIAQKRLENLLVTIHRNPEQLKEYHDILMSYVHDGFVSEADLKYTGMTAYLPHRPVVRIDAETTKVRPVFDGSLHRRGIKSLNANLEAGPNMNPDIMGIMMRFRRHKIAWTAVIQKAFLQIEMHPDHAELVRFLSIDDPSKHRPKIVEYRWKRLPFGLTSSPFILRAVLTKHLRSYETEKPGITKLILDQIYVDDWMGGAPDVQSAVRDIRFTHAALAEAKMPLVKYNTGCRELVDELRGEIAFSTRSTEIVTETDLDHSTKALGIIWDPQTDHFSFNAERIVEKSGKFSETMTKRQLFSLSLMLYDPLGLITPVTLPAKLVMRARMRTVWLRTKDRTVEML
jgi:hypothetical protein